MSENLKFDPIDTKRKKGTKKRLKMTYVSLSLYSSSKNIVNPEELISNNCALDFKRNYNSLCHYERNAFIIIIIFLKISLPFL